METNTNPAPRTPTTVTAKRVLRAEGMVSRYDIDECGYGMSYEVALEVLEANGFTMSEARDFLAYVDTHGGAVTR